MKVRLLSDDGIKKAAFEKAADVYKRQGLALIVLSVAGVILAICFRKRIHLYPAMEKISWGEKYLAVFLNIGMVLFLAMCTVQFVI